MQRFRSAYKPLLHYFLEEVERDGLIAAEIRYPLHEHAQAKRFTLEAYPLVALLDGVRVTLQPGASDLHYDVDLRYADGREIQSRVFALNQLGHAPDGVAELSPTGWLRVRDAAGETRVDAAQATEYQLAFRAAVDAVRNHAWGAHEPYFERLEIRVDLPGIDFALPVDEEIVSTYEALHEDLYFAAGTLPAAFRPPARRPRPAARQIIPDVRRHDGAARVRISVEAFTPISAVTPALPGFPLAQAREPLSAAQIAGCMAALGGDTFQATSRQAGRCWAPTCAAPVPPSSFPAPSTPTKPPAWSALRAAQALAASGKGHFALIAAENPDGYAPSRACASSIRATCCTPALQRAGRRHRLPRARAVLRARRPPPGARHQRGPAAHQPARLSRP